MSVRELEQAIVRAQELDDQDRVRALQREYRSLSVVTRVTNDVVRVREPVGAALTASERSGKATTWPDRSIPSRLVLRREALEQIENAGWVDYAELGGFLFGSRDGDSLVVDEFSCVTIGERDRVDMGAAGLRAIARRGQLLDHGRDLLGWLHSHPETSPLEPLRLSDYDERMAVGWAVKFEESIAQILVGRRETPGADVGWWVNQDAWFEPRLAGWLVHRDRTVRPADIEIERSYP